MMSTIEKVWTTTAGLQAAVLIVTCQIEKGGPTYRRHRCGYVAIPSGHQLHGKSYDDDVFCDVDVHGGLTFSGTSGDRPIESIDSSDWLLGFDCAHSGDGVIDKLSQYDPPYEARSLEYCVEQCEHLAQQLVALVAPQPSTPPEYYPSGSKEYPS